MYCQNLENTQGVISKSFAPFASHAALLQVFERAVQDYVGQTALRHGGKLFHLFVVHETGAVVSAERKALAHAVRHNHVGLLLLKLLLRVGDDVVSSAANPTTTWCRPFRLASVVRMSGFSTSLMVPRSASAWPFFSLQSPTCSGRMSATAAANSEMSAVSNLHHFHTHHVNALGLRQRNRTGHQRDLRAAQRRRFRRCGVAAHRSTPWCAPSSQEGSQLTPSTCRKRFRRSVAAHVTQAGSPSSLSAKCTHRMTSLSML